MATLEELKEVYGESYSQSEAGPVTLQVTPQTQTGDLAFLRRQGVTRITLAGQKKDKV